MQLDINQQRIEYNEEVTTILSHLACRTPAFKWYLKEDEEVELVAYELFSLPIADEDIGSSILGGTEILCVI